MSLRVLFPPRRPCSHVTGTQLGHRFCEVILNPALSQETACLVLYSQDIFLPLPHESCPITTSLQVSLHALPQGREATSLYSQLPAKPGAGQVHHKSLVN